LPCYEVLGISEGSAGGVFGIRKGLWMIIDASVNAYREGDLDGESNGGVGTLWNAN